MYEYFMGDAEIFSGGEVANHACDGNEMLILNNDTGGQHAVAAIEYVEGSGFTYWDEQQQVTGIATIENVQALIDTVGSGSESGNTGNI
jgi:hypothetical protein